MADITSNLPRAEQGDAAEVALALETARALWSQGHGLESVRWIQRAAENAESAGNDLRAVSLARAAADLRAEVGMASEPAPPLQNVAAHAHEDDFSEKTIVDSVSQVVRRSLQSGVQIGEIIPEPASSQVMATPLPFAPVVTASVSPSPVAEHQAVRVAVLSQNHATRELTLRMLGDSELAPVGSTEALLVSLDPQRKLLG